MEPKPFDVKLIMGDSIIGKQVAHLIATFELKPENVSRITNSFKRYGLTHKSNKK
jgi:hypothetical protein